jgi:hypothetical protein
VQSHEILTDCCACCLRKMSGESKVGEAVQGHCAVHTDHKGTLFCKIHMVIVCDLCVSTPEHRSCPTTDASVYINTFLRKKEQTEFDKEKVIAGKSQELLEEEVKDYEKILEVSRELRKMCEDLEQTVQSSIDDCKELLGTTNELQSKEVGGSLKEKTEKLHDLNNRCFASAAQRSSLINAIQEMIKIQSTGLKKTTPRFVDATKRAVVHRKPADHRFPELADSEILRLLPEWEYDLKREAKLFHILKEFKWSLAFRASRDGFTSQAFHEKCDNVNGTLFFAHAEDGTIFGGYSSLHWTSSRREWATPEDSMLFRIRLGNNEAKMEEFPPSHAPTVWQGAAADGALWGPWLGTSDLGVGVRIGGTTAVHFKTCASVGRNYLPTGESLATSNQFQLHDLEVYISQGKLEVNK